VGPKSIECCLHKRGEREMGIIDVEDTQRTMSSEDGGRDWSDTATYKVEISRNYQRS
jgi:hypothetical protein